MASNDTSYHGRSEADNNEFKELSETVASNINKINQTVSKIQRMTAQLDTTKVC
jgi:hypothetical protein